MRQNYTRDELQSVLGAYPELGEIKSATMFTSGFENSNFLVETTHGNFVVKVFESVNIDLENIIFEIEIMDRLYKAGIKSPKIFQTIDKKLYTMLGEKIAIVMNFIEGENMAKKQVSDILVAEIGEQVGKMDAVLQPLRDGSKTRQDYEYDLKNLLNLKSWVKELDTEYDQEMILRVFKDFSNIKKRFDKMPSGLIHNDVVLHNILADGNVLKGITDFSDMAFSPYIQNIAVALSQICFTHNWRPKQASIFINSYKKFHSLSEEELSLLPTLIAGRFVMLILAFNHSNVTSGIDVQRTEFINNNVRYLKRFLEIPLADFSALIH